MIKEKQKIEMRETLSLLLIDGSEVQISYPEDCEEFGEVYGEMIDAIENGKWWNVGNWCSFTAKWKNNILQDLNCRLVVGSF